MYGYVIEVEPGPGDEGEVGIEVVSVSVGYGGWRMNHPVLPPRRRRRRPGLGGECRNDQYRSNATITGSDHLCPNRAIPIRPVSPFR